MNTQVLAVLTALLIAPVAKADKFWMVSPDEAKLMTAGSPACLVGVLVAEDANTYTVRVVGGQVVLAKKSVVKIEKDGLTLDDVSKFEKADAERVAAADKERQQAQAAEASARRVRTDAQPVDATAHAAPLPAPLPAPVEEAYDPVLHVVRAIGVRENDIRAVELAFNITKDPRYRKMARQLREMR